MIESVIDIRYPDCDPMGVVHHAVYPLWYEIARMNFFSSVDFPWEDMNRLGIDPAMVSLDLKYHAPLFFPGSVTVRTKLTLLDGKKIRLHYECYSGERCVNEADSFHIWTRRGADGGMKNLTSIRLDDVLPEVYGRMNKLLESE